MALVVLQEAFAQGAVGDFLQVAGDGGGHPETFGVGVAAVATDHFGARHLGDVGGGQFRGGDVVAGVDRLVDGLLEARLVDAAKLVHAAEDPVAPFLATGRVDQRVEARRRLGQAGDHGHLRQAEFTDGLAVIDLGGGLDTIGAVTQVDLVHIKFKNLVFAEFPFNLQGQQYFIDLARETSFAGKEVILRHLHGDGAAARLDVAGLQ
ncbi:hypothetical protein D3C84_441260 [compost metagenome]